MVKLVDNAKELLKSLNLNIDNKFWKEFNNDRYLVLGSRREDLKFTSAIWAHDLETARAIVKWNYDFIQRIIDLEDNSVVEEVKKMDRPRMKDILPEG